MECPDRDFVESFERQGFSQNGLHAYLLSSACGSLVSNSLRLGTGVLGPAYVSWFLLSLEIPDSDPAS